MSRFLFEFDSGDRQTLVLSFLAGLSTLIGGSIAVIRQPDEKFLALFLGLALGTVTTLAILELYLRNAYEHGALAVSLSLLGGVLLFSCLHHFLPKGASSSLQEEEVLDEAVLEAHNPEHDADAQAPGQQVEYESELAALSRRGKAKDFAMLRLGLVMVIMMTLHNLPVGIAVAFSSFTDIGPFMTLAVAIHNIPEGVIVAGPIFVATGRRLVGLAMALISGMAQPLGALLSIVFLKSLLSQTALHYTLAAVGGIMIAICLLEIWPAARCCKEDKHLFFGLLVGCCLMIATILYGS